MKIVKGDTVYLLAGADVASGKRRGTVLRVLPDKGKVIVDGLNLATKHQKARAAGATQVQQGGRIEMPMPIPVSRVMLVCPHCDKPSRVGMREQTATRQTVSGEKTVKVRVRICKKCGEEIGRPTETIGAV